MLAAITELADSVASVGFGALLSAAFATLADANANLAYDAGSVALIYDDTENDLAVKSGASGSGSWALTTILRDALGGASYANLARDWASKPSGEVDPGNYPGLLSALQYAQSAAGVLADPDFVAVNAALGDIGTVADSLSPITTAADNIAAIVAAPAAASQAEDARDEAVAAAASVPVGAGQVYEGRGQPPENVGSMGAWYYDTVGGLLYGPRTADGWLPGVEVPRGDALTSTIYDLTSAPLSSSLVTCVRAQSSTDLTWEDDRTTYETFGANVPVWHPTRGYLVYAKSQQLAPTPVNPGNGTFTFNAPSAGRYIIWGKGPGTATSAAGDTSPATATGFGTITLATIGYQVITVTSAGNIKVTLSGTSSATLIQCEYFPDLPSLSVPTPFMPTTGTRDADQLKFAGALLSYVQGTAGAMYIDARVPVRASGAQNSILGMGNYPVFYASGTAQLTYLDTVDATNTTLGSRAFADTTPPRLAFTWDASTIRYAMGDRVPREAAHTLGAGLSRTSVVLGGRYNSNTVGEDILNGAISRIEIADAAALMSSEALYRAYSPIKLPTLADMIPSGFVVERDLPATVSRLAVMLSNTTDYVPIFCLGNSFVGGVQGRANSWPVIMASQLLAAGVPAYSNSFTGTNGNAWTGGTNAYDGRATYTGTAPSNAGIHPSNGIVVIPAGTALTITFATSLTKLRVYTANGSGYGSYQVKTSGSAITPDEGGSATVSTAGSAVISSKTFTASAATAWTITASVADVWLQMAIDVTPGRIQIINGGSSGAGADTLATDSGVLNSFWELPRAVAGPLTLLTPDHGNSSINSLALSTYRTSVAAQITKAKAIGDVVAMTHMSFAPELAPYARDRAYALTQIELSQTGGAKVFDVRAWEEGEAGFSAMHDAGFYVEATKTSGLHFNTTANTWIVAPPLAEMLKDAWLTAGGTLS